MFYTLDQELKVAASSALQQRGCVHIIGLGEIQRQVGGRWDRLKEMVWGRLDNLLRQQLGAHDFHLRINDLSFLVSMPSVKPEEAEMFCLRVAHELHIGLLGSCESSDVQVSRVVSFDDDVIETLPVGPGHEEAPAAPQKVQSRPAGKPVKSVELVPRIGGEAVAGVEVCHRFMPIWDARREVIASYRCISLYDQSLADNLGAAQRARFELDLTVTRIRHCVSVLSESLAGGGKFLVWIPVSYDILGSPVARTRISTLCRSLPPDLRSLMVYEICDLPYGVPQSRLLDLTGALKPYCRGIVAQLPARIANYGAYLGAGLQAIGLSLLAGGVHGTEMDSEMFKLCAAARRQHLMCFVFDIPSEEQLQAARDLGINLLSGPLIGMPLETPVSARRLRAKDIPKTAPRNAA